MVPIRAAVLAFTLLALCLLATNTSAAYYSCCHSHVKTRISFRAIKGYSVQTVTEMCPINAIIFLTSKGKVCTNPALKWVMDYVHLISNKAQKVHIKMSQATKPSHG
uniref:Chemokine interleukin-8-like domain-containing protein n=1 Tax=Mola mola TaxID=94237 RepID=A0A3Q3WK50_MOLML